MIDKKLIIVSRKWENGRGKYTSVERFCELLSNDFEHDHGKTVNIPYRIGQILKKIPGGKKNGELPAPYNSYSASIELYGINQILKRKPNIVFFPYADYDFYYTGWLKKILNVKVVLWTYFSEWELEHRFKNLSHFKKADLILVAGEGQLKYLKERVTGVKLEYFPMGVDTDFFIPSVKYDKYTIVHSGANRRDFKTLIKAFDILIKDYPSLKLELIGAYSVKDKIPERDYIILHPYLSDEEMRAIYQKANFQVLSLYDGGSSNSLNEGIACGLPLIVTGLSNIDDYYNDSFALTYKKGDYMRLYENIKTLLENDNIRQKYSKNAREYSLRLSWNKLKVDFLNWIDKL